MGKVDVGIRQKIRQLMKDKSWSGDRLALESGLSKSFVYCYLKADKKYQTIKIETLEKLAEGLEVQVRDLIP
jgi:DNA-binding Xre family transcriptional regulator